LTERGRGMERVQMKEYKRLIWLAALVVCFELLCYSGAEVKLLVGQAPGYYEVPLISKQYVPFATYPNYWAVCLVDCHLPYVGWMVRWE